MKKGDVEINRISVCGYKSINQEQSIAIRPLTILAGANNSGKSSIMQPLLLLKQTLEIPYDPGPLLLHGPNIKLTAADQIFSKTTTKKCKNSFYLKILVSDTSEITLSFRRKTGVGLDLDAMHVTDTKRNRTIFLTADAQHEELMKQLPEEVRNIHKMLTKHEKSPLRCTVVRTRCFFHLNLVGEKARTTFEIGSPPPSDQLKKSLQAFIHVPGLRGNPERVYPTTSVGPSFPGVINDYIASIIANWQQNDQPKIKLLGTTLEHLGLTWKVRTKPIGDTHVEIHVGRLPHCVRGGARDLVSVADVGFGVSQVLPVIVALLVATRKQMVYIEQPEIHLHPRAQSQLALILAAAVKRGVNVIVETHSKLLLRGIQTLVAEGYLTPDDVQLHWFRRKSVDGSTEIYSGNLDIDGSFGDWPEDFDEVTLGAEEAYLDAVTNTGGPK